VAVGVAVGGGCQADGKAHVSVKDLLHWDWDWDWDVMYTLAEEREDSCTFQHGTWHMAYAYAI
jgi:hypothetical protein